VQDSYKFWPLSRLIGRLEMFGASLLPNIEVVVSAVRSLWLDRRSPLRVSWRRAGDHLGAIGDPSPVAVAWFFCSLG
jgi:hypothetical protein